MTTPIVTFTTVSNTKVKVNVKGWSGCYEIVRNHDVATNSLGAYSVKIAGWNQLFSTLSGAEKSVAEQVRLQAIKNSKA